jgi:histidinol dehydrogenase
VIGDYIAGPSHVLPTGGTAKYFSPLSASTFIKSTQIISFNRDALWRSREHVQKLTDMEGLMLHKISLEARFVDKDSQKAKDNEKQPASHD